MHWRVFLLLMAVACAAGCADREESSVPGEVAARAVVSAEPNRDPEAGRVSEERLDAPRVVFLGDSLTAGFGLAEEQAFPALLAAEFDHRGTNLEVINAGVSGDTTAGGLERVDWLLRQQPEVVVLGLGTNDGLRGLQLSASEENLRRIVERSRAAGAKVLLLGMMLPPNYGRDYADDFAAIYPRLAAELRVPLVPFLLDGVGGDPAMNLADGIHPNALGHQRVAANVLPYLEAMLAE